MSSRATSEATWSWVGLAVVYLHLIVGVVAPFLLFNELLAIDSPGHVSAVQHIAQTTFPLPSGWDPLHLTGVPQGVLYPPLVHYLAAIGVVLGLPPVFALKLLVAVALLATPALVGWWAHQAGASPSTARWAAFGSYGALLVSEVTLGVSLFGGTLASTLNSGLLTHAVTLPVFVAYAALLHRVVKGSRSHTASALLAITVTGHAVVGLAAAVFTVGMMLAHWHERQTVRRLVLCCAWAVALSAWWTIPFVVLRGSAAYGFTGASLPVAVGIAVLGLPLAILAWRAGARDLVVALATAAGFVALAAIVGLPLQLSRFTGLFLLALPVLGAVGLQRSRWAPAGLSLLLVGAGAATWAGDPIGPHDAAVSPPSAEGRVMDFAFGLHQPSTLVLSKAITDSGNQALTGLFVESDPNARWVVSLRMELDDRIEAWGVPIEYATADQLTPTMLKRRATKLRLFGASHMLTDLRVPGKLLHSDDVGPRKVVGSLPVPDRVLADPEALATVSRTTHINGDRAQYGWWPIVGGGHLAEPLQYWPEVRPDYDRAVQDWFLTSPDLHVFTDAPYDHPEGSPMSATIGDLVIEPERWRFRIEAAAEVPVLVKMNRFVLWRATADGRPIPLLRASPNLGLLIARGEVELRYVRGWEHGLGAMVSLLGLLGMFGVAAKRRRRERTS